MDQPTDNAQTNPLNLEEWLENPKRFRFGQEAPHTNLRINEKWRKFSLCGNWKFNWSAKPTDRPIGFQSPDYSVSNWDEIEVPSNWQLSWHS